MQLYALSLENQTVHASQARRQTNYYCLECKQIVRLRGGPQRQRHFYHLDPTPACRQHQKSEVHLQLQLYFLKLLPPGDCSLELRFPSINRIADVAWMSQKIIFEIQCSPIAAEEIRQRNCDYEKMGWTVVWILHDRRYNQLRLSAAEMTLRQSPHFFSNMNAWGQGMIYDQFDICLDGLRKKRLPPLAIDISSWSKPSTLTSSLLALNMRFKHWKMSFAGDLMHLHQNEPANPYLQQALASEKLYQFHVNGLSKKKFLRKCAQAVSCAYQTFFRFILEKMCH